MRIGSYDFSDPEESIKGLLNLKDSFNDINYENIFDDEPSLDHLDFNPEDDINVSNPDVETLMEDDQNTSENNEIIDEEDNKVVKRRYKKVVKNSVKNSDGDDDDYEYEDKSKKKKPILVIKNKFDPTVGRNRKIKRNRNNMIQRIYKLSKTEKTFYLRDEEYFFFNNQKIPVFLQYLYITCSKKEYCKNIIFHPDGGIQIFDILGFKFKFVIDHFRIQYTSFLKMMKIYNFELKETDDPNIKIFSNPFFKKYEYNNLYYIKNEKIPLKKYKYNRKDDIDYLPIGSKRKNNEFI